VRGVALATLIAALALSSCGGDDDDAASGEQAFKEVETQVAAGAKAAAERAAPRWEPVKTLSGSGDATATVSIAEGSLQWRARWTCIRGSFQLNANEQSFGRASCPGRKMRTGIETGEISLSIRASGPWRLTVEQQVDTPLHEPALPEMSGDTELASGSFYKIERRSDGTAKVYRLPDGRTALRFEGFKTAANPQLFVWLSSADRPRTTKQVLTAPHTQIGLLKSTLGDQNYILPANIDQDSVRSVAIWCKPIQIAYTAASLTG
jgi:Electron transfer DM13